uniref:Uncharacterized protein LOC110195570 n=1 Tax=Phascolarctos cinereus TaxID=38626 RepID=A0A6P5IZP8_PHACI|nr:uncharacterized protein LOC110195570 [Phascolarctos cinereus]
MPSVSPCAGNPKTNPELVLPWTLAGWPGQRRNAHWVPAGEAGGAAFAEEGRKQEGGPWEGRGWETRLHRGLSACILGRRQHGADLAFRKVTVAAVRGGIGRGSTRREAGRGTAAAQNPGAGGDPTRNGVDSAPGRTGRRGRRDRRTTLRLCLAILGANDGQRGRLMAQLGDLRGTTDGHAQPLPRSLALSDAGFEPRSPRLGVEPSAGQAVSQSGMR